MDSTLKDTSTAQPDTWCPLPWIGLSVRTTGDVRYCCHANGSKEKGLLKIKDEVLNLGVHQMSDAKNAELIKKVRLEMLQGQKPEGCRRCYEEEDSGLVSRRQREVEGWQHSYSIEKAQLNTEADGAINEQTSPIKYLDLRYGNRCNLKCRMCSPRDSSKWYDQHFKLWGMTDFKDLNRHLVIQQSTNGKYALEVDPYNWYENERYWKEMDEYLPNLEKVYFAGGEPLLIEAHFQFLQKCIERNVASKMVLEYNSNIMALSPKILSIWEKFKQVNVGVSIDGIGPVNDYIRSLSKWDMILSRLQALDSAPGNYKVWLATTVQIYNIWHLPEMMQWIVEQNFQRVNDTKRGSEIFTPHPLKNPSYLSIYALPPKSKERIVEHFDEQKIIFEKRLSELLHIREGKRARIWERYQNVLDSYAKLMMKEDLSPQNDVFWYFTDKLDEISGLKLKDVCPQVHELMKI